MSNTLSRPLHLGNINAVVSPLTETGWTFKRPSYTKDNKAYLCRGIPPVGEMKLRFLFIGADDSKFYIIVIGDKWNTVGITMKQNEDLAIEILNQYLEKARTGYSEELPKEINDLLAAIAEEDA